MLNGFVPSGDADYDSASRAARKLIEQIVQQNFNWMEIAKHSADARRIINEGKLAVVLSLEMNGLSEAQVDTLVDDFGVAHIIPIHLIDNDVGGTAATSPLFNASSSLVSELHRSDHLPEQYIDIAGTTSYGRTIGWPLQDRLADPRAPVREHWAHSVSRVQPGPLLRALVPVRGRQRRARSVRRDRRAESPRTLHDQGGVRGRRSPGTGAHPPFHARENVRRSVAHVRAVGGGHAQHRRSEASERVSVRRIARRLPAREPRRSSVERAEPRGRSGETAHQAGGSPRDRHGARGVQHSDRHRGAWRAAAVIQPIRGADDGLRREQRCDRGGGRLRRRGRPCARRPSPSSPTRTVERRSASFRWRPTEGSRASH